MRLWSGGLLMVSVERYGTDTILDIAGKYLL
jgi:hypothetical protein